MSDIAVLMGGWSAEREVSLVSGAAVMEALQAKGHAVRAIDAPRDPLALIAALTEPRPAVVFNALHGQGGEDGIVQAVLQLLGLAHTHSGLAASAIGMDKALAKRVATSAGIPVAEGRVATREEVLAGDIVARPFVLKPVNEGSSVGVQVVRAGANATPLTAETWSHGERVLVERYIPGRELTVGVMGARGEAARALTVTQIDFAADMFDYTAKYTAGHARHVLPAPVPAGIAEAVMRHAVAAHEALGCNGVSRSDFRWDDSLPGTDGLIWLEINTQPGFTPMSLVPEQAAHIGLAFPDLCDWLVETALCPR